MQPGPDFMSLQTEAINPEDNGAAGASGDPAGLAAFQQQIRKVRFFPAREFSPQCGFAHMSLPWPHARVADVDIVARRLRRASASP